MTFEYSLGLLVSVAVAAYVGFALLRPERL